VKSVGQNSGRNPVISRGWRRAEQVVAVLEGDQARLERAQHRYRGPYNQRCPQHQMYPDGWREVELNPGGETDDNQAKKQDHEDCRSVPGVLRR
jgi:hypothetical protein